MEWSQLNHFLCTSTHFRSTRSRSIVSKNVAITPTCYLSAARASKRGIRGAYTTPRARSLRLPFARMHVFSSSIVLAARPLFPLDKSAGNPVGCTRRKRPEGETDSILNKRYCASSGGKRNRMYHRETPTKRPYRRAGSPACTARVYRFSHRRTATATPSLSLRLPLCQWCRDNLLFTSHPATASAAFYSERTNERTRPLPKKLTSRNPTWHRFVRGASPSFSLLALEFARRTAQSASSCPLVLRVSGKKPSSHGRPMQDEGRDQDIASGVSVRRVGACVELDYCVRVARVSREIPCITLRSDSVMVNEFDFSRMGNKSMRKKNGRCRIKVMWEHSKGKVWKSVCMFKFRCRYKINAAFAALKFPPLAANIAILSG